MRLSLGVQNIDDRERVDVFCFSAIVSGLKAKDLQQFVGENLFSSPLERYPLKKLNNLSEHSKSRAVEVRRILEHKKHRLLASFIDTLRCKQA